jgi:release factor glutamine methyltransferase
VLDLCTGSGCVAITLARERPTTEVTGTDISADAIALAEENALRLGAYNTTFVTCDLYGDTGTFDLITANPPYIATGDVNGLPPDVARFEPRLALDGGADGLDIARRIVTHAHTHLCAGGVLAIEVGQGLAERAEAMLREAGFTDIERARDYARIERVVSGVWRGDE